MSMRNQRMDNLSSGGVVPRFMYLSLGFQLMVFAQILLLRQKIQKIVQSNNLALLAYIHIFADTKKNPEPTISCTYAQNSLRETPYSSSEHMLSKYFRSCRGFSPACQICGT